MSELEGSFVPTDLQRQQVPKRDQPTFDSLEKNARRRGEDAERR